MAYDNSSEPGIRAARAAFKAALLTFATSTVPPLAQPVHDQVRAADPNLPMFENDEQKVYTDLKIYVDRLILKNTVNGLPVAGQFTGPPLPLR